MKRNFHGTDGVLTANLGRVSRMATPEMKELSTLEHDADWQLVLRIAGSQSFARTERLRNFLLFVCRKALLGQEGEISEQTIGVSVFDRTAAYNPGEDSIVRSNARLLRQRLESYFENEGRAEWRRVTIPKGGYVPLFEDVPSIMPRLPVPVQVPESAPVHALWSGRGAVMAGVLLAIVAFAAGFGVSATLSKSAGPAPPHPFWSLMFSRSRATLFVFADNSLVMHQNFTRQPVNLGDYISRSYRSNLHAETPIDPKILLGLSSRRYTSAIDMHVFNRLVRLGDVVPGNFRVRYARDTQLQDLKESNVILSGAREANPWSEPLKPRLNFLIERLPYGQHQRVINVAPAGGEEPFYDPVSDGPTRDAFGHVAFLPNLGGNGHILLIEGTGAPGTESAADFLLNDQQFLPLLDKLRRRDGSIADFEFLVRTKPVDDGRAPAAQLIGYRVGQ